MYGGKEIRPYKNHPPAQKKEEEEYIKIKSTYIPYTLVMFFLRFLFLNLFGFALTKHFNGQIEDKGKTYTFLKFRVFFQIIVSTHVLVVHL